MKTELKDAVIKSFTDKLSEIADAVVKQIQTDNPPEKKDEKPANGNSPDVSELVKKLDELKTELAEFKKSETEKPAEEKPVEKPAESADELKKKQDGIKAGMLELVKSMGIDTDNVDVDFVVKEKKKGAVGDDKTIEKKSKDEDDDDIEDGLEKQLSELDAEEKSAALDHYFKSLVFGKK